MKVTIDNPFLISGYESPRYFCDRETETKNMLNALKNGRNITLTSPRRMGKTGLILHLFHQIKEQNPSVATIYIDLYATTNSAEFTKALASAVLGQLDSDPMKILKKAEELFRGIRPTLSFDPINGKPKIGLDFAQGQEESTLEQVFNYLKQSGRECYIALDEFQQIASYPEKNIEAQLRTHIQQIHNAHFIFSGSQEHMLAKMFLSPARPFYQSTAGQTIGPIDMEKYYTFASSFFSQDKRMLPKDVFQKIYDQYEGHTWYVQKLLNHLYGKSKTVVDEALLQEVTNEILQENEYYYQMMLKAYSKGQDKLLKAIAREKKVKEITAGSFISRNGLVATSSVKSAAKRLLEDEVLYAGQDGIIIYDRLFSEWLNARFSSSN